MPSLADHQSNNLTKLLLIGDAKTVACDATTRQLFSTQ